MSKAPVGRKGTPYVAVRYKAESRVLMEIRVCLTNEIGKLTGPTLSS